MSRLGRFQMQVSVLFFLFVVVATAYTNCGRATLGNLALNSGVSGSGGGNSGQSVVVTPGACPANQVAIGLAPDMTIVCAPVATVPQTSCSSGNSLYQQTSTNVSCVVNTSYSTPGTICPVGQFLQAYTSLGAITCAPPSIATSSCPVGQYQTGVTNGTPTCSAVAGNIPNAMMCASGKYLFDVQAGALNCQSLLWPSAASQACASGYFGLGWVAGNTANGVCETNHYNASGVTVNCPSGKILIDYLNGAPVCSTPPNPDVSHACRAGTNVHSVDASGFSCQTANAGDGPHCPVGQFTVGLTNGAPVCAAVVANSIPNACPSSSYPNGMSNGNTVCANFQNLNYSGVTQVCTPASSRACAIANGAGSQTCVSDGSAYGTCSVTTCNAGFVIDANACRALACVPGSTQSCPVANGQGQQFCSTAGAWGTCQVQTCSAGFTAQNGACVSMVCTPGATQSCSVGAGTGSQVCLANGNGYGACNINACQNGYTLRSGSCVDTTSPTVTFTTRPAAHTVGTGASLAFAASDAQSGLASVTCTLDSANYAPCSSPVALSNLASGSHTFAVTAADVTGNTTTQSTTWSNDVCTAGQTMACSISNGAGAQTCAASGQYGGCIATSCNSGYRVVNGTCAALNCPAGYSVSGNNCVDVTPPSLMITQAPADPTISPNASIGFAAGDTGSGIASITCSLDGGSQYACQSPTNLSSLPFGNHTLYVTAVDGSGNSANTSTRWRTFICSPAQIVSCGIANGAGQQTCNADGSGYGSCAATSCNDGFVASNGACVQPPSIPVYRYYNARTHEHYHTLYGNDPVAYGFVYEGVTFGVFTSAYPGTRALYRCTWVTGYHFLSIDSACEHQTPNGLLGYIWDHSVGGSLALIRYFAPSLKDHMSTVYPSSEYLSLYTNEGTQGYAPTNMSTAAP